MLSPPGRHRQPVGIVGMSAHGSVDTGRSFTSAGVILERGMMPPLISARHHVSAADHATPPNFMAFIYCWRHHLSITTRFWRRAIAVVAVGHQQ